MQFNLSHCQNWAVVAVVEQGEVGVDIELCDRVANMDQIAQQYFAPKEVALLSSVESDVARMRLFVKLWTIKEAFIKYTGEGLSRELSSFEVNIVEDNDIKIKELSASDGVISDAVAQWQVHTQEIDLGGSLHFISSVSSQQDQQVISQFWVPP